MVTRLIHFLIAFARYSSDHETTSAPHGAFFNACSFLKTGPMVLAQAIQLVIFFAEVSLLHRLPPLTF